MYSERQNNLAERPGDELEKDAQYKAAIAEEQRLYELLDTSLNEEQQAILKNHFVFCPAKVQAISCSAPRGVQGGKEGKNAKRNDMK